MLHLSTERRWSAFLAVFLAAAGCDGTVEREADGDSTSSNGGADGAGGIAGDGGAGGDGGSIENPQMGGPTVRVHDTVCVDHDTLWAEVLDAGQGGASGGEGGQGGGNRGGGGAGGASSGGGSDYPDGCPPAADAAPFLDTIGTVTGPISGEPGQCCYDDAYDSVGVGRPMFVEGRLARADVARGDGWSEGPIPIDVSELSPELRARLHDHWLEVARFEHASIASFAKLSLELLMVGAPVELVREAQRAGLDEVEHATTSFAIAAAYGGVRSAPRPMPELAGARPESDVLAVVRGAIAEGCVAETLGAFEVGEQAALAASPALARALATIADDESRHAALAWRFVRWAVEAGQVEAATVREAFAEAIARHRSAIGKDGATSSEEAMAERHGLLSRARRSALHLEALGRIERLAEGTFQVAGGELRTPALRTLA